MTLLDLDPDELLSTTRAVRKRLDFDRPVPADLIRECVAMALQAPSGGNVVTMRFVVVRDEAKRRAVGEIYRDVFEQYKASRSYPGRSPEAVQARVASSAEYLSEHMAEAPVLIVGCNTGADRAAAQGGMSNILPAAWSLMLAARARGLGTAWTTLHLRRERDVAEVLGIPYDTVAQAVLTPLAYTRGTDFRPAARPDPESVIHWDTW